ncbi:MAG: HK97 family phage prohead protease [Anaerolineaceae bacterium]
MGKPTIEGKEIRNFTASEIRSTTGDDGKKKIEGYAAVFNQLSDDLGGFREQIAQGAFTKTLKSADVRGLWNHNSDYPLGRTKAKTLTLSEDNEGLKFSIIPPDTQYARDLLVSIERGDVDQMSFGFMVNLDKWELVNGEYIRTLLEVELFDVSPVTYPAYPQTSAAVRSKLEEFTHANQVVPQEASEAAEAQARNANRKRKLQILLVK